MNGDQNDPANMKELVAEIRAALSHRLPAPVLYRGFVCGIGAAIALYLSKQIPKKPI